MKSYHYREEKISETVDRRMFRLGVNSLLGSDHYHELSPHIHRADNSEYREFTQS